MPLPDPYYPGSVYPPGSNYPPGSSYPPVTGAGYSTGTYAGNYPAYSMGTTSGAVPATMYANMSTEDPRYANYIYSQTNQGYPQERYPQYTQDPRYEPQQPLRGYLPSAQDPMGRQVDRPQYYDPQPPYNPNPAPQYPRQGQPAYEAPPPPRDPYRPGGQQNQYGDGRRR